MRKERKHISRGKRERNTEGILMQRYSKYSQRFLQLFLKHTCKETLLLFCLIFIFSFVIWLPMGLCTKEYTWKISTLSDKIYRQLGTICSLKLLSCNIMYSLVVRITRIL